MIIELAGKWSTVRINRKIADKINVLLTPLLKKYSDKHEIAGSYRRQKEEMGDMDYVCLKADLAGLLQAIDKKITVLNVPQEGRSILTVVLQIGKLDVQVQFNNCVSEKSWGAALLHSTGSGAFNQEMRSYAKRKGFLLNQKGLFKDEKWVAGKTEQDVFDALGMNWVPPINRSKESDPMKLYQKPKDEKHKEITPGKVKVGFVGTQQGMKSAQIKGFIALIKKYRPPLFIHDDTIGSASQAHDIVRKLLPKTKIYAYPPKNPKNRANKDVDKEFPATGGLDRVKLIVYKTDLLIAAPKSKVEDKYSGTWVAINFAKHHAKKPTEVLFP